MNKHFVPLHLHTEYSLLDGAIKIKNLLSFALEQNWKAVGISDHGNIFGAVTFFQKAKKAGIKPILGTELYFVPDAKIKDPNERYYHLLIIVQNKIGYKNLCQLMAYAYKDGFYFKPRIDLKVLEKFNEGLIIGTACIGGYIPKLLRKGRIEEGEKAIEWFLNIFGRERFYFEIMPPDIEQIAITNRLLLDYSKKYDIKCIATTDSHYMKPEDKDAHEVLLSIQTKKQLTDSGRMTFGDITAYLQSTNEMLEIFKDNQTAIWNTGELADKCDFEFEFGKLFFPEAPIPQNFTPEQYFEKSCLNGLKKLKQNGLIPENQYQTYNDRLKLEMDLIIKMGFVGYFLIVSDFIKWAKKQNIAVGPGRGSAAGSLVAWAMEITNVDPIKYNLLFERFLNPERISMPDIDIDFCVERREEVINHVKEKYGHDCVCQIITFGTMMAKGVIKDVARVLGFPFQDSNALTDLIPNQIGISLKESIEKEPKLQEMIDNNPKIKQLFDISFKLEGLTRHASKHAAGVVISPQPLRNVLPLYIPSAKSTELISQYSMVDLENIGYLKMDFLGLKNLTVIERILKYIKQNHGIQINLDKLALDNQKAFELLKKGQTNGIFQLESEGLKDVLRKLQPEKFEDIIAVNALYRPGPLGSGMVDDFIERRHGRKKVTYMFDELEPILAETYGVIVYQEQVMKIASAIAGYSLGQADILRRAMGKKKVEVMAQQKKQFLRGAKEKNKDAKTAGELFDLMAYFAGYGFNKSHSTAYALIAYQTAFFKANYPAEFMAALTSFETNDPDKLSFYLQEINEMGLDLLPPNINNSEIEFSPPNKNTVLFGLKGIKSAGMIALENIIKERKKKPFIDLLDFCKRIDLRTCNKRVVENLIYAGAMDCFPGNRAQKIKELDKIIDLANTAKEDAKTGQMSMFGFNNKDQEILNSEFYEFAALDDWTTKERLEKEKAAAGFYLSSHPLKSYKVLRWLNTSSFAKALEIIKNPPQVQRNIPITAVALIKGYREITTKKGDKMAFAQFEDLTGHSEVIIFPRTYAKVSELLTQHDVFIIRGNIDLSANEKCKLIANELIPLETLFEGTKIINGLNLELTTIDESIIEKIQESFVPGNIPVSFSFNENGQNLILNTRKKISISDEPLKALEEIGIKIQLSI